MPARHQKLGARRGVTCLVMGGGTPTRYSFVILRNKISEIEDFAKSYLRELSVIRLLRVLAGCTLPYGARLHPVYEETTITVYVKISGFVCLSVESKLIGLHAT